MTGNSGPTLNEEGYIMKRSILGSIECFEKHIKQNNFDIQSQSVKFKEFRDSQSKSGWKQEVNSKKDPVTIVYYGIKEIQKAQNRQDGLPKNENTFTRKKSKIEELK